MKKTFLLIAIFLGITVYSQEDIIIIMKNDKIVFNGTANDAKSLEDGYFAFCKKEKVRKTVSSSYHPDSLSAVKYVQNAERLRSLEGGHKVFSQFETEIFYDKESDGWYVKFIQESVLNPKISGVGGFLDWLK